MIQQLRIIQLPQRLVDRDGYGVAQIQTSCFLPHGDADTVVQVRFQEIFRKTLGLFAEKQIAIVGESNLCIAPGCFCGKTPKFLDIVLGEKVFQVIIDSDIHKVPIVQACPADSLLRNVKTQRADQVQPRAGGGAGAGDVAAILGDLRFVQYNIEQNVSPRKSELRGMPGRSPPYCSAKAL